MRSSFAHSRRAAFVLIPFRWRLATFRKLTLRTGARILWPLHQYRGSPLLAEYDFYGYGMREDVQKLLKRLEAAGLEHDSTETEHSRKFLNLEPPTAEVIAMLLRIACVRNLLEIGTSNGYSTVWLASTIGPLGGRVTSIDRETGKQAMARENLAAVDLLRYVDLFLGDATEIATRLPGPFDCIFLDADRVSAPKQLDMLLPKLSRPALLLADNATSHPDQIAGYLARVEAIEGISHTIIRVGKGLSVAYLPNQ
jgi:predicted O-methyltransferase YrrM